MTKTPVEILKNTAQELRGDSVLGTVAVEIVKEVGESILNAELERVEGEIGIQKKVYKKSGEIVAVGRKKVAVATTLRSELMGKIEALQDHANYIKSQIKAVEEI